jgi:hypothetical protein
MSEFLIKKLRRSELININHKDTKARRTTKKIF